MNNKAALHSGIVYTLVSFLTAGVSFIMTPIFTRIMSTAAFGAYNNFISWVSIVSIIVTFKISASFISARYDFKNNFDEYVYSVITLCLLSTGIALMFVNVFGKFWMKALGMDRRYVNLLFVYSVFYEIVCMHQIKEQYYFRYRTVAFFSIIIVISTMSLSLVLLINMSDKFAGRIWGQTLPVIILGIIVLFLYAKNNKKIKIKYWLYALPIVIPYIPHSLSLILLNSMDRIMITKIRGEEETALYSLAYTCGSIVTILVSAINNAYSPWLADKLSQNKIKDIRSFAYTYVICFFTMTFGITLVAPELLWILGGKKYMVAMCAMPPVMMGCVCQFLYTMYVNIEQFKKKTLGMAIASVVSAVMNYFLNWFLIPKYGYMAAAYTTLASYFFLLIAHMFLVCKIQHYNIYNNKFIILISLTGIILAVIVNELYVLTWVRYCVIVIYIGIMIMILYKNRNVIWDFIRSKNND